MIDKRTLPDCLEITAWTENQDGSMEEIMGVRHKTLAIEGCNFTPVDLNGARPRPARQLLKMKV